MRVKKKDKNTNKDLGDHKEERVCKEEGHVLDQGESVETKVCARM